MDKVVKRVNVIAVLLALLWVLVGATTCIRKYEYDVTEMVAVFQYFDKEIYIPDNQQYTTKYTYWNLTLAQKKAEYTHLFLSGYMLPLAIVSILYVAAPLGYNFYKQRKRKFNY